VVVGPLDLKWVSWLIEDRYAWDLGLVCIGIFFLFLFSVSDFLVFEMILFQILKFEFVSNVSKFEFRNSQSKQNNHIDFLKNPKQKQKKCPSKPSRISTDTHVNLCRISAKNIKHISIYPTIVCIIKHKRMYINAHI
jgi:hypothetical protein